MLKYISRSAGFALIALLLSPAMGEAQSPGPGTRRGAGPILEPAPLVTLPSGVGAGEPLPPGEPAPGESPEGRVRALFERLGEAYREEDQGKIATCFDPTAPNYERVMMRVTWFLKGANYFRIEMEPVRLEERENRAEGEVLVGYSLRLVTEPGDRYRRDRLRIVVLRREGRDVFRLFETLPPMGVDWGNPVSAGRYDLRVRLRPVESALEVEGTAWLWNRTTEPVSAFSLEMAPLVEGFRATDGAGREVEAKEDRGAAFQAEVRLPEPLAPGTQAPLGFRYTIRFPGRNESSYVGPDDAYLIDQTAWFPWFRPVRDPATPAYDFDLEVAAPPGYLVASTGLADSPRPGAEGVMTWRFRSHSPVSQIPIVAGRFEVESRTLREGRLPVTLWLLPGAPRAGVAPLLAKVDAMLGWLEERLGPVPAPSLLIAPVRRPTLYGSGSLFAVGQEYLRGPRAQEEGKDLYTNWWGHHLAHLWFVSGIRPTGTGEMFLREGFSNYFDLSILDDFLSKGARASLLRNRKDAFRNAAGDDQPLAEVTERTPNWEMLMGDKAPVVVAMLRNWLGEERFRAGLAAFFQTYRGRDAGLADLETAFATLDPTVRDLFSDQVYGRSLAGPAIVRVESGNGPSGGARTALTVRNDGAGRAAVPIEFRPSKGTPVFRTVRLGPGQESVVEVVTPDPITFIRLDPEGEVLELKTADNDWPPQEPLRKRKFPPVKAPGALPDPYGPRRPGATRGR